ncbi:hypothetical protein [Ruegeria sp. TM1040]|uniref:hypothetical protein n=1 Tax=Ruegeria sp. (strain TM1040) TaxID=292414 RepID=UPI00004624AB|nr:hypothetical protein [Ruegeria sp. TM1040]
MNAHTEIKSDHAIESLTVGIGAQCTSRAAFLDQIEEAEQYRADPKFAPNEGKLSVLRTE